MPNNATTKPFDAAAAAVMHADAQGMSAQPEAPAAGQLVNAYRTLARYVPAPDNAARAHGGIAPPIVGSAREAADLMAHAAILRASTDIERDQFGAELAQRLT